MNTLQPKLSLLDPHPTPLQYLSSLSQETFREIYIKRDDLTPLGGGGHTLRKLEYLMYDALQHSSTTIVTVGSASSSHSRLTAAAAAKYGLRCVIVTLGGEDSPVSTSPLSPAFFGARIFIKKDDGRNHDVQLTETVHRIIQTLAQQGEQLYFIPMGGSDVLGMLGYYHCAAELDAQARENHIDTATVYAPVETMGTFMGLYCGLKAIDSRLKLTGIAAVPADTDRLHNYFQKAKETYGFSFDDEDMHIETTGASGEDDYADTHVCSALRLMAEQEGILLDPAGTGHVFAAILAMIREKRIKIGRPIILMHTGGIPCQYTKKQQQELEKELSGCVQIIE